MKRPRSVANSLRVNSSSTGEFVVHDGDHEIARPGRRGTLDDDDVALVDAGVDHRVALDGKHERTRGCADQVVIDEEGFGARRGHHVGAAGAHGDTDERSFEETLRGHPGIVFGRSRHETGGVQAFEQLVSNGQEFRKPCRSRSRELATRKASVVPINR